MDHTSPYFEWLDPDSDDVYEIWYIVTQGPAEGPEHYVWRKRTAGDTNEWQKLPPFVNADDMRDIETHFHGAPPLKQTIIRVLTSEPRCPFCTSRAAEFGDNNQLLGCPDCGYDAPDV
jgi:hypothetical protein